MPSMTETTIGIGGQVVWRSTDSGTTWAATQVENPAAPGTFNPYMPGKPFLYQMKSAQQSIPQDGSYVYLGSYNQGPAVNTNPNYVYRSSDDGVTWRIASTSTVSDSLPVPSHLASRRTRSASCLGWTGAIARAAMCTS